MQSAWGVLLLRKSFKRSLEFGWGHACDALKNSRKILRIVKAQHIGDLCEIKLSLAYELFCFVYFLLGEEIYNSFSRLLMEKLA